MEHCDVKNEIIHNTKILKPNICDFNDVYILVRDDVTVMKLLQLKYHLAIDDAGDLHLVNVKSDRI